ncbi:MAG: hypothetical protein M3507_03805 [Actinomycetota bacterium]|nr:hypothetical protein [Actinomycetota bacterium]
MVTDWLRWPLHLLALAAVLLSISCFFSAARNEPWWFGPRHAQRTTA